MKRHLVLALCTLFVALGLLAYSRTPAFATTRVTLTGNETISLTEVDGSTYYTVSSEGQAEQAIPYEGTLEITSNGVQVGGRISVDSGSHAIVLDNVKLVSSSSAKEGAIQIASGSSLDVTLEGENWAHGTYMCYGIKLPEGATLTFNEASTGSIDCAGEDDPNAKNRGWPGIGDWKDMGTLVVNGGNIVAHASRGNSGSSGSCRANAIGTQYNGRSTCGTGGDITITGGTVTVYGTTNTPAIGALNETPSNQRGNLTMTGGALIVNGSSLLTSVDVSDAYVSSTLSASTSSSYKDSLVGGTVHGSYTLDFSPSDTNLTVPNGASLTIPTSAAVSLNNLRVDTGGTLAVNGTIESLNTLSMNGTLMGSGSIPETKRLTPTTAIVGDIPTSTYTGLAYDTSQLQTTYTGNAQVAFIWYADANGAPGEQLADTPINAGTYWLRATTPETGLYHTSQSDAVQVQINKATPVISAWPTASLQEGQTLADAVLEGGSADVAGTFKWEYASLLPSLSDSDTTAYALSFVPEDTVNYEVVTNSQQTVHVEAAPVTPPEEPDDENTDSGTNNDQTNSDKHETNAGGQQSNSSEQQKSPAIPATNDTLPGFIGMIAAAGIAIASTGILVRKMS